MKKSIYLGAVMIALSFSAQATLIGDSVSGSATGMAFFSGGTVGVTTGGPEFFGSVSGPGGVDFTADFDFGASFLNIYVESNLSGTTYPTDFSVTFTDLDWAPGYILAGLALDLDDPLGTGEGLLAVIGDHSLTLDFTDYPVPEFREVQLGLDFGLDTGGGPSNPIPEPATLVLLGMGLVGLVARKRMR